MTTFLAHAPLESDVPDMRPALGAAVGAPARVGLMAAAAAVGATAALLVDPSVSTASPLRWSARDR
jgi:hypothetical protein